METFAYVAVGALVGLVIGLTGIGGGSLMTPLLIVVFRQSATVAVGTDLLFAGLTKLAATLLFGRQRGVDWVVCRQLLYGSLPAALLTLGWMASRSSASPSELAVIRPCLALLLIGSAIALMAHRFLKVAVISVDSHRQPLDRHQALLTIIAGLFIGAAVTLTSVGAGALATAALVYIYSKRLTPARLVATDIAHALPLTVVAGIGHSLQGHVDYALLLPLLVGSMPGVWLGTRVAVYAPQSMLRAIIALMLAFSGWRLWAG